MENIQSVEKKIYSIFEDFEIGKITSNEMCDKLKLTCKGSGEKSYWWRFFPNDTLVNDANTVKAYTCTIKNWQYLRECIQIALKNRQLIVYYS